VKETTDVRDKLAIYRALEAHRRGRLSRRGMLKALAAAGVVLGTPRAVRASAPAPEALALLQESTPTAEVTGFLRDVGGQFRGATVKVVTEDTPPGRAIQALIEPEFTALTGIAVEWETLPLDQVLARVSQDAAGRLGSNDVYYLDQAWVGRFVNDTFDPRELLETKPDLAFPNYDIDDFLQPLVERLASYGGKMIGLPCDIPIFIYMYRRDVYDELGLQPATTMQQYMDNARAINEALSGEGTYGTVGMMKSGHYALAIEGMTYCWAHGGSVFTADGQCSFNDEQAVTGIDYLRQLQTLMPSGVTTWDWSGQSDAVAQGQAGQVISATENLPGWDDPAKSQVSGLFEPMVLPRPVALRPPEEAGYEEVPNIGRQGGSTYGLSRYSKNADAAWVFLQWATSSDIQTRASILGGGASPMRQSTYDDPRIAAMAKVGPGTTRHFPVMLEVINTQMGSEPHLPQWPEIVVDVIAVELGTLTTGGYGSTQEALDAIKQQADEIAAG
jgi:multiple sugar transport system substrate-binding protein